MRVTPEGNVSIPAEVREALGIDEHTEVEWEVRDREAVLRIAPGDRLDEAREMVARMVGAAQVRWTTDELMRMTRGDDWNKSSPS